MRVIRHARGKRNEEDLYGAHIDQKSQLSCCYGSGGVGGRADSNLTIDQAKRPSLAGVKDPRLEARRNGPLELTRKLYALGLGHPAAFVPSSVARPGNAFLTRLRRKPVSTHRAHEKRCIARCTQLDANQLES